MNHPDEILALQRDARNAEILAHAVVWAANGGEPEGGSEGKLGLHRLLAGRHQAPNPVEDSLAETACRRQLNYAVDSFTNVRALISCPDCWEVVASPFHLAASDKNEGQKTWNGGWETACGTRSENLASSRSLALVSCKLCLTSERFRTLKGGH